MLALTLLIVGSGYRMAWTSVVTNQQPPDPFTTSWLYDNAHEFWNYFVGRGYTKEAVAGMMGNITHEGCFNPGQVQINLPIADPQTGRGLCGWTPGTKIISYANSVGADWYDGPTQCDFIYYYYPQGFLPGYSNWVSNPTMGYNYSWSEFTQLTNVEDAACAFLYQAENPKNPGNTYKQRITDAYRWYNEFSGETPIPVPPDPGPPPTPQPPGSMDMKLIGGRDVMRRIWFKH